MKLSCTLGSGHLFLRELKGLGTQVGLSEARTLGWIYMLGSGQSTVIWNFFDLCLWAASPLGLTSHSPL